MKTYTKYDTDQLAHLQEVFSKKDFLTVEETGIWLKLHPNSVRKLLESGEIVGSKLFGSRYWRVNVRKTKAKLGL